MDYVEEFKRRVRFMDFHHRRCLTCGHCHLKTELSNGHFVQKWECRGLRCNGVVIPFDTTPFKTCDQWSRNQNFVFNKEYPIKPLIDGNVSEISPFDRESNERIDDWELSKTTKSIWLYRKTRIVSKLSPFTYRTANCAETSSEIVMNQDWNFMERKVYEELSGLPIGTKVTETAFDGKKAKWEVRNGDTRTIYEVEDFSEDNQ